MKDNIPCSTSPSTHHFTSRALNEPTPHISNSIKLFKNLPSLLSLKLNTNTPKMLLFFFFFFTPPWVLSLNQEGDLLNRVRLGLDDPTQSLSDWNTQDPDPCKWHGITCDSVTQRVSSVSLPDSNLMGPFPSLLCLLPQLSHLSLSDNLINESLPSNISTCQNLRHLNLAENLLVGPLPSSLPSIPSLRYLDLSGNNFSGEIPATYGTFQHLEILILVENLITGTIPPFLGSVSTMKQLSLSYNLFEPGPLPGQLGNIPSLEVLWLSKCNLVGPIPDSLSRLKKLKNLDLSCNNLNGTIPSSITELSSVEQIELYNNSLTGKLPLEFSKLVSLKRFDVSTNKLEGLIPTELCELPLESLNLYENRFVGTLPTSIANSPNLYELKLFDNRFTGELPSQLGKKSALKLIDVSRNKFSGVIPDSLCANGVLEQLLLIQNSFSGSIPESLSRCSSLTRVRMRDNLLSGEVPDGFWGLPNVQLFELIGNSLGGSISKTISKASNISVLLLSQNNFTGSIPDEIGASDTLVEFSANDNLLSGPIPKTIAKLSKLSRLDLHNNELSGELPDGVQSLKHLNELNLSKNRLSGKIPVELGSLPVLNYLDLSENQFSGEIPVEIQNLKLNEFNFSSNRLSGSLPPLLAKEMYRDSFLGNPGLCSDIKGLCPSRKESARNENFVWFLRSIFVVAALVLVGGVSWFYVKYRSYKKADKQLEKSRWILTSFHKFGFSEYELLGCLDEDNVIGSGASGKVYKAVLSNGDVVAVKKLWGGLKKVEDSSEEDVEKYQVSDDGFEAEVETLGKIRHKNIVKLWCCCTTRDCKLLVYEYMPNGSLGDLLHSKKSGLLDWSTRYKIALDAAEGLSYLHHDCVPPIVHRDIKSNNILLDGQFGARVADFGVAKVVDAVGDEPNSMSVIAGSCGYIAPEYAYTLRVNEKSDIYSFGVVILELITGRLPVDVEFGEKDLVKWVCYTVDQKGVEHVIDPKLDISYKEEICKVLNIGILCTSPLPINRPPMRRIVKMLQEVTMESKIMVTTDGKLSPYYYEDASDQGSVV